MDTNISILLIVAIFIAYEVHRVFKEIQYGNDLLKRISLGLFPIPNGGLDNLVYLQHINDKLEETIKIIKQTKEKIEDVVNTTDVIKDEIVNKN